MKHIFKTLIKSFTETLIDSEKMAYGTFYELQKIAQRESAEFINENLANAVLFSQLEDFHAYAFEKIPSEGLILEFGVFQGQSLNFFAGKLQDATDKRTIHGFDSFEGLSEDWTGTRLKKNAFDVQGQLPSVKENVELHKGWVDQTLPGFLEAHAAEEKQVAFLHLDMDTYEPTLCVLEQTRSMLTEGTIIVFDELLGYSGWKDNEYKALLEALAPTVSYEFIGFCEPIFKDKTSRFIRAAIRITGVNSQ